MNYKVIDEVFDNEIVFEGTLPECHSFVDKNGNFGYVIVPVPNTYFERQQIIREQLEMDNKPFDEINPSY